MSINGNFFISKLAAQIGKVWRQATQDIPSGLPIVAIASMAATGLLLGVRHLGGLQPLELTAWDLMVRLRPDEGSDPRLLVVAITEQDIQAQKLWPLSDRTLAQLLTALERYQPQAIGLDIHRSIPKEPGHQELVASFQSPKLIAVTSMGNTIDEKVPPPPSVPEDRIGFSDLVLDPDGTVRRNLMYANTGEAVLTSFSLRLALAYLAGEGIEPQLTPTNEIQFNKTAFAKLKDTSGGYQTIDASGYQVMLNYRSARNVARQVTLTQILTGKIEPNWVKDKIVLIGVTAPTIKDLFFTPYSGTARGNRQMAGVLIHAQMVSQILSAVKDERPLFWFWPEWGEVLWIATWAVVGGVAAWRIHRAFILVLVGTALLAVLFGIAMLLFMEGGWIPLATPAIALIITGTSVGAYQLQQAIRQQQMVMKLLGQQTSPEIATALWHHRDRLLESGLLPGQKLTATLLMTDIKGFSTIAEQYPPEVVMSWLNEYLAAMTPLVQTHQGVVNKFTGDGLLAVFGVPVSATNPAEIAQDAHQAVSCAMAMGDRLEELNRDWQSRSLPVVQMRVGIFTGPVMVGSLGGKERLEYGVIGDSVNIAARLESCEKDRQASICRVLIAKETLIHLQEQFQVESWGSLALKGKERLVDVYRVVGLKKG
ncbi:MAG TPA: adenylate/guanylate cyclase domain-containing protein [Cyanobacteria bacterium UBA8803]|nr:adenylate/guanylate cyclase domain-containing protein [Cyanobacteria bacterium UBA9273]HBL58066.1 adenylate/guanylate cyclase domain-containing protein [Cyanobacteria bacterium UBA8803]